MYLPDWIQKYKEPHTESGDHHFKWWFDFSPIRAYGTATLKRGIASLFAGSAKKRLQNGRSSYLLPLGLLRTSL